jgi:hypothetical protein
VVEGGGVFIDGVKGELPARACVQNETKQNNPERGRKQRP